MKVLIDPAWDDLAEDLSVEEQAEILRCILGYPKRDSRLGLWKLIKKQLDKDAKKYTEKCEHLRKYGKQYQEPEQDSKSVPISAPKQEPKPAASSDSSSITNTNIKKEKVYEKEKTGAGSVNSLIRQFSKEHSMDYEGRFEIAHDFSFVEIIRRNGLYAPTFSAYLPEVLQKAQDSLIKKRLGQKLTMKQLIAWIEQAQEYYEQDKRSAK